MPNSSLEMFNAGVDAYVKSDNTQPVDHLIKSFIVEHPYSWHGFRGIASVLESEGDLEAAKECFKGNFPDYVQKRFFDEDVNQLIDNAFQCEIIDAHARTTVTPKSAAVHSTHCIRGYIEKALTSAPTSVQRYENVNLWFDGFNTVVMNKQGRVDKTSLNGNAAPAVQAAKLLDANHIKGKVVLLGCRGSNNYYHWMTDLLPQLEVLRKAGISTDKNTRFVFSNVFQNFKPQTLNHFGISDDQIYSTNRSGSHIQADELIIPVLSNFMGLTMGAWLPSFLKKSFGISTDVPQTRKLLVTRNAESSHGRGILNLDEFNKYFIDQGYELVLPENYTVMQQAQLFSEASHVAGPHGAGLTNIAFCSPGTSVHEFYGPHIAPCYWAISELSGLNYYNYDCSFQEIEGMSAFEKEKSLDSRRSSSLSIDLSAVNSDNI